MCMGLRPTWICGITTNQHHTPSCDAETAVMTLEHKNSVLHNHLKCTDVVRWTFIEHTGELDPVMNHGELQLSERGVVPGPDHAVAESGASTTRVYA